MSGPNWTLTLAEEGRMTAYWATWGLRVEVKAPGATTLTVAEADLEESVLLVAVTTA